MGLRTALHSVLEGVLGTDKVYFQPPSNVQIQYPCIVYAKDDVDTTFADNNPYRRTKRYSVTVIDQDPDSDIPDRVGALPSCIFRRAFVADKLHHDVFVIYF